MLGYVVSVLKGTIREFLNDHCPMLAAAISYYTVFSLPPLLVLVLTLVGALVGGAEMQAQVVSEVNTQISPDAGKMVETMMRHASERRSHAGTVLGLLALLVGATGAFMHLQYALNEAWNVPKRKRETGLMGMIVKRVLSLGMILVVGFLLLVALVVTTAVHAMGDTLARRLPDLLSGWVLHGLDLTMSLVLVTALFAAIYRVLPDIKLRWRDVAFGAFITAVLFVVGKFVLSLYLSKRDLGDSFGAAGALAVIFVWVYYAAMIMLLGAEFTQVWLRRHGEGDADATGT